MSPVPGVVLDVVPLAIVMGPVVAVAVIVPVPAVLTFAFWTIEPPVRVMGPLPVEVAPATVSVPVVLVRLIAPAPVAVAVKLAPFVSVMNTPPEPDAAVTVPAVVWIFAPAVPIPLAPTVGVVRMTLPAPAFSRVPALSVMEPPVALPPVFVATVIFPPEPTVMFPSAP